MNEWMVDAPCRYVLDPDIFFVGENRNVKAAKEVCSVCPVRDKCARLLWDDQYAIVAGLTPRERMRLDSRSKDRIQSGP